MEHLSTIKETKSSNSSIEEEIFKKIKTNDYFRKPHQQEKKRKTIETKRAIPKQIMLNFVERLKQIPDFHIDELAYLETLKNNADCELKVFNIEEFTNLYNSCFQLKPIFNFFIRL